MVGNGLRKRRAAFKVLKGTAKFFISPKAFYLPSSRMVVLRFVGRTLVFGSTYLKGLFLGSCLSSNM